MTWKKNLYRKQERESERTLNRYTLVHFEKNKKEQKKMWVYIAKNNNKKNRNALAIYMF